MPAARLACTFAMAIAGALPAPLLAQPAVVSEHARLVRQLEQRPLAEVEQSYLQCERAASEYVLGPDEAAWCSLAYEALLARRFGGNFPALVAWSREQRLAASGVKGRSPSGP